jgi:hypothetical protein
VPGLASAEPNATSLRYVCFHENLYL